MPNRTSRYAFPVGTEIVINRSPWTTQTAEFNTDKPTHRVVGHREDGYLRIRPLDIPDGVMVAEGGGRKICIETYIPANEVITFPKETPVAVTPLTIQARLNGIAIQLSDAKFDELSEEEMAKLVSETAVEVSQIANELEAYDLQECEDVFPTPRQALTLGYFLHSRWNGADPRDRFASVSRGGGGLGDSYLHVRFPADGYEGGIDREGRLST